MLKFFKNHPEVLAVLSEREDSSMKLFGNSNINAENRNKFFEKIGVNKNSVVAAEIVHGTNVNIVNNSETKVVLKVDGLVTNQPNIFLSVTVADCVPVYFYESKRKIIALAHCGWRGITQKIIGNTFKKILNLGRETQNIEVILGPGIGQCHFEIKEDILNQFEKYPDFIGRKDGKIFADLKGIIKKQIAELGVKLENIKDIDECTFENPNCYFSYRRDKPEVTGAMIAVIGIKQR